MSGEYVELVNSFFRLDDKSIKLLPWQEEVLNNILTKGIKTSFIFIPKKQGKTLLVSIVSIILLMTDDSNVYSAALTRDQASMVFDNIVKIVDSSPALKELFYINQTKKRVVFKPTGYWYQALASEAGSVEGLNGHIIYDELHVAKNDKLYASLKFAGIANPNAKNVFITTAGEYADNENICYNQYNYSKGVLSGAIDDPSYYAYIKEADKDDDPFSPQTWAKANPSLGYHLSEYEFRSSAEEARNNPRLLNQFKRYRLNLWCGSDDKWLDYDVWKDSVIEDEGLELYKLPCYLGIDLSRKYDFTAIVAIFRDEDRYIVKPWFYAPRDNINAMSEKDGIDYYKYAEQDLTLIPGDTINHDYILNEIIDICNAYKVQGINIDTYNIGSLDTEISKSTKIELRDFVQIEKYYDLSVRGFERKLIADEVGIVSSGLLNWMAQNTILQTNKYDQVMPSRKRSSKKIDGIAAMLMSFAWWVNEEIEGETGKPKRKKPFII